MLLRETLPPLLWRAPPPPCKIRTDLIFVRPFVCKLQSANADEF